MEPFLPQGYNLNNLGRGPLDKSYIPNIKSLHILPTNKKFFPIQVYNLNNVGRGPLDEATYQISKTWDFYF